MEQVVGGFDHRVADMEQLVALGAAHPYGGAGALAALGQVQRAGPGIELPADLDAFQGEGFLHDARGDALVRQAGAQVRRPFAIGQAHFLRSGQAAAEEAECEQQCAHPDPSSDIGG
ncbi:hypothetical protein D3C81_1949300 [compost metagenome]